MPNERKGLYEFGPFRIDAARRLLTRDGRAVPLKPKTFDLLLILVESQGRVLTKSALMKALWPDTFVEEANLSFQISTLRKALGEQASEWIETVPKHGYRFGVVMEAKLTRWEKDPEPSVLISDGGLPAPSQDHPALDSIEWRPRSLRWSARLWKKWTTVAALVAVITAGGWLVVGRSKSKETTLTVRPITSNALVWPNLKQEDAIVPTVAMMAEMAPQNATEAMLAIQMIAASEAALLFLKRATAEGQTLDGCDANVFRATRLMRIFNEQLAAMQKLKGKAGQQKVTVEHVHVHKGGQAIVGTVAATGPGPGVGWNGEPIKHPVNRGSAR
jgi:DNA-binding winged helix-turn-helix (wHTH) protein